jgi:hypothetical protein
MASAAISGDYVDLKFVKGRKVAQIVIEIPIEAANAFVQAFGTPSPAEGVPVALARLQTPKSEPEVTKPHRRMNELPLPQQAGILSNDLRFAKFVEERHGSKDPVAFIREHCRVASRSQLEMNKEVTARFYELRAEFDVWKTGQYA